MSSHRRRKFRLRAARANRAADEAGRFYATNEAWKTAQADVPFHGNPVPYEARLLLGGHNNPTYAVSGKIVDGAVKPLGRYNPHSSK